MDANFFNEAELLNLKNNNVAEEECAEDMELERIDVVTWKKKNGLCVVQQENRLEVLCQHYDSQVAGKWGKHQTQELVSGNNTGNKWLEYVARYVAGYVKGQKSKADGHRRQTKLLPMPKGEHYFEEIAMDFVGELLQSEGFNAILVATDQFTQVQYYIPAKTTWTAEVVANFYVNDIWKLHSLPKHIMSDRGPQFTSKFLK